MRRLALAALILGAMGSLSAQTPARSDWIPKAQFAEMVDQRSREGFYPAEFEGDCRNGSERIRVTWMPKDLNTVFYGYSHMSREFYERQDAGLRARGYQRKAFNEFTDCAGKTAVQATWVRTGSVPRSNAPVPTVAVQSEWILRARYQEEFDKRVADGFYPDEVKAECNDGNERVRVLWRPLPSSARFSSFTGMAREVFDRREADMRARGFDRKWMNEYTNCKGEQRFIAVWMRQPQTEKADATAASPGPLVGGWVTSAEFRQDFDRRAVDGLYPDEIQGQCQKGTQRYRATWKERPVESTIYSYVGMPQELYERRDAEFRARGFERVWMQQLGECAGAKTFQATWVKAQAPTK